jgi:hypothetical protein
MKLFFVLLTSLTLAACGATSTKGKWNDEDRKEALSDVKEFSSALETVGSAKDMCYDCYIDSLDQIYDNYDAAKKLNEDDRLSILMDCAIQYIHFD